MKQSLVEHAALLAALMLGAYLVGAVPFAYLVVRAAGQGDIRRLGSGNVGATNVARVLGRKAAVLVYLLDGAKGLAPTLAAVWAAQRSGGATTDGPDADLAGVLAGAAALAGHIFPVYLGFRGGKGVATASGVLLALMPGPTFAALGVWVALAAAFRYVSAASMGAALVLPAAWLAIEGADGAAARPALTVFAVLVAALVLLRHRANVGRLRRGEEPRIGGKGRGEASGFGLRTSDQEGACSTTKPEAWSLKPGTPTLKPEARSLQPETNQPPAPGPQPPVFAVLGTGAFGVAMAAHLARRGHDVRLWGRDPARVATLRERRRDERLPEAVLPEALTVTGDFAAAAAGAALVVTAVPTRYQRAVLTAYRPHHPPGVPVLNLSKGMEPGTGLTGGGLVADVLGPEPRAVLVGPSHAEELARGLPTSVVVASGDADLARRIQQWFADATLRVYTNPDVVGVELGGVVKNVIAVAAGICDGLGFGDNTKAALITRGLAEMARFGVARGADRETFLGLAGVGDLVTTCVSRHSRNRALGEALGRGRTLADFEAAGRGVAEGATTARALAEQARALGVEMPITEAVAAVLYEGRPVREAVRDLMTRTLRDERG